MHREIHHCITSRARSTLRGNRASMPHHHHICHSVLNCMRLLRIVLLPHFSAPLHGPGPLTQRTHIRTMHSSKSPHPKPRTLQMNTGIAAQCAIVLPGCTCIPTRPHREGRKPESFSSARRIGASATARLSVRSCAATARRRVRCTRTTVRPSMHPPALASTPQAIRAAGLCWRACICGFLTTNQMTVSPQL
ncbi:hypothetical protein BV25DRAFT_817734 [Artomyces pyxidatus]|uniref:Uncharacterized protein n=1 Tax=Artomyces pyxidatus TaxID=48021 RepID=A0ACB8SYF0_9AGAM|nr:hypothetical protein BV25DRAFT_817734 [Artomyces pyxidatus]